MPIEAFAHAIPSIRHKAADLARVTGADEKFIIEKIGVETRYVLGPDETGISLSVEACRALAEKVPGILEKPNLLVVVTQNPDRRLPQNSAGLAAALGLPSTVASFDLSLGCSGYVYALTVAEGFMAVTGMHTAVVVTCDPYSRIIDPADKDTNCVFGDAATATLVRAGPSRGKIIATDFGTQGEQGDAICVPDGGAARPLVGTAAPEQPEVSRDTLRLHMRGRAVFNFVNSAVPESISRCLEAAGMTLDQIDLFALHQGSRYMLEAMARRMGIPSDRLLQNMSRYGNTVSSSIPLLLSEVDADRQLDGRVVLMSGFGVGLSWGTAIVQFSSGVRQHDP
jgi:3-oxoacyl-[acyl-carrier-protein] synthase-3